MLGALPAVLAATLAALVDLSAQMGAHHLQLLATLVVSATLCHFVSPRFNLRSR